MSFINIPVFISSSKNVFPENNRIADIPEFAPEEGEIRLTLPFLRFLPKFLKEMIPNRILKYWFQKSIGSCLYSSFNMLKKMSKVENQDYIKIAESYSAQDKIEDMEMSSIGLSYLFEKNTFFVFYSFIFSTAINSLMIYLNCSLYFIFPVNMMYLTYIILAEKNSIGYNQLNSIDDIFEIKFSKEQNVKTDGYYLICLIAKKSRTGHCLAVVSKNYEIYIYDCNSGLYKGNFDEIIHQLGIFYFKTDEIIINILKNK